MRWIRRVLWVVFVLYWGLIALFTHIPVPRLPPVQVTDKTAHFIAYGVWAMLGVAVVWRTWPQRPQLGLLIAPLGLVYGAMDELTQPWFNRSSELRDWLADALGLAIGVSLMLVFRAAGGILRRRSGRPHM